MQRTKLNPHPGGSDELKKRIGARNKRPGGLFSRRVSFFFYQVDPFVGPRRGLVRWLREYFVYWLEFCLLLPYTLYLIVRSAQGVVRLLSRVLATGTIRAFVNIPSKSNARYTTLITMNKSRVEQPLRRCQVYNESPRYSFGVSFMNMANHCKGLKRGEGDNSNVSSKLLSLYSALLIASIFYKVPSRNSLISSWPIILVASHRLFSPVYGNFLLFFFKKRKTTSGIKAKLRFCQGHSLT